MVESGEVAAELLQRVDSISSEGSRDCRSQWFPANSHCHAFLSSRVINLPPTLAATSYLPPNNNWLITRTLSSESTWSMAGTDGWPMRSDGQTNTNLSTPHEVVNGKWQMAMAASSSFAA